MEILIPLITFIFLTPHSASYRFNDQEIVALSGGHAVGRCHADRSGFDGPWTFSPITVTNDFFKLLFDEKWVWKKWNGPKQLEDKKTKSLMMLPCVLNSYTEPKCKSVADEWSSVRIMSWSRTRALRSMPGSMRTIMICSSRSTFSLPDVFTRTDS